MWAVVASTLVLRRRNEQRVLHRCHDLLGFAAFRNAIVVRRLTRDRPDLAWARDLATMGQLSLAGYWVAGTFLSMAYYDVYYTVIAILTVEREIVARLLTQPKVVAQGLLSEAPMPADAGPVASSRS